MRPAALLVAAAIAVFQTTLGALPALAQDRPEDVERVARAYLAAYETVDLPALEALAAEDIVFLDESAPSGMWGGPYVFNGRAAWLEGMGGFVRDGGLIDMHQDHEFAYQSGVQMLFAGHVDARYRSPRGGVRHLYGRIVTVITVRDGRVVRHQDIADYNGFTISRVADEQPEKVID